MMMTQPHSVSMQGHGNVYGDNNTVTVTVNGREEARLFVNVPPQPRLLVGRDALLADLKARLMQSGCAGEAGTSAAAGFAAAISAVRGLPGVGKTTLATALAYDNDVLAYFGGGIFWGDLGPSAKDAEDAGSILRVWADPLSVDVAKHTDPNALAGAVGTALARRGQPVLLVVDDAWAWEPLAVLQQVDAPGCARLLTTRQQPLACAFAGDASAVTDLEELVLEQSFDLLRQLAPNAVELEPDAARDLAALTGGLPLALTLVGQALAAQSYSRNSKRVQAVIEDLKRADARLTTKPTGAERTLQAAIALSDQLVNDARWYALGAFAPKPADFDEDAALAVLAMEDGARLLYTLCDLGLIEDAGGRYSLHQTVTDYARMQPEEHVLDGESSSTVAAERHAGHYLGLANADRKDWRRIEAAWSQIKHAWQWVRLGKDAELVLEYVWALHEYLSVHGLWNEYLRWHSYGLEAARSASRRKDEGTLLNNLSWVYRVLGDPQRALETYEEALAIRRKVGDRVGEGTTLNNIGLVYDVVGDKWRALETYEEALAIRREMGDWAGEGTTLNNIGEVYRALGDQQRALRTFEEALAISREVGDRVGEGTTLNNIAAVYHALGEPRRALDAFQDVLAILQEVGNRAGEGTTLNNIGLIYQATGDNQWALEKYEEALAIHREVGNRLMEGTTLCNIGGIYNALGDKRRALGIYEEALAIRQEVRDRAGEGTTLNNIAAVHYALGELQRALMAFLDVLVVRREVGDRAGEGTTLNNIGKVYDDLGDNQQALATYGEALAIRREVGHRVGEGTTLNNIGWIYVNEGDYAQARMYLEQALEIAEAVEYPALADAARNGLARIADRE